MDQTKIGLFIAKCRKDKKLTQGELAKKLGVTDKAVSKWENGRGMPDISLLSSLSEALGITINELLSGENLNDKTYREKAEENLLLMFSNSSFTLKERIAYFEKKWKKEHAFYLVLEAVLLIVCLIGTLIYAKECFFIVVIGAFIWSKVQYNKMMIYIEKNAYGRR